MSHIWSGRLATCGSQPYQTAQLQKGSVVTEISRCSDLKSARSAGSSDPLFYCFCPCSLCCHHTSLLDVPRTQQASPHLGGLCFSLFRSLLKCQLFHETYSDHPVVRSKLQHSILLLCSLSCYWNPCKYYTVCLLKLFILNPSTMM